MKYILILLIQGLTLFAQGQPPIYKIGDTLPCGAIIVDTISTGAPYLKKFLVCAPADISSGQAPWSNGQYIQTNATQDQEDDRSNANRIIQAQGYSGNYAALLCNSYTPVTYCPDKDTVWYLPSRQELLLIYKMLGSKGQGHFASEGYWTSVEDSLLLPVTGALVNQPAMTARRAWLVDFYDGSTFPADKANKYHIRPVRTYMISYGTP